MLRAWFDTFREDVMSDIEIVVDTDDEDDGNSDVSDEVFESKPDNKNASPEMKYLLKKKKLAVDR